MGAAVCGTGAGGVSRDGGGFDGSLGIAPAALPEPASNAIASGRDGALGMPYDGGGGGTLGWLRPRSSAAADAEDARDVGMGGFGTLALGADAGSEGPSGASADGD